MIGYHLESGGRVRLKFDVQGQGGWKMLDVAGQGRWVVLKICQFLWTPYVYRPKSNFLYQAETI